MAKEPDNGVKERPTLTLKDVTKRAAARNTKPQPDATNGNLSSVAVDIIAPTEANIREIRARIEEAFNALGTEALPGTLLPVGRSNNAREAADFALADLLAKLATERLKNAKETAEKAGVFGNKDDYITGDTVMVFSDPNFSINVKMGKPSKMIDRENVETTASEFLGKRASEFLERCFKERAATKQIIVSIK